MKARCTQSAADVSETLAYLDRRLELMGVETQPEVACKILNLVQNKDAAIGDYAKVIRTDAGLSGRLLRIANSAYYAQRKPVTAMERACILLGIERLKSFALGFYLSKAAASDSARAFSKLIWGQSVYRAFHAACVARQLYPNIESEAFVVGLMLDAGIPLMTKLVGDEYSKAAPLPMPPGKLFKAEFQNLAYTHVDVMATLCRRWKLPDTLANPIQWHHTPPADTKREDPVSCLHRIAYYVGAMELDQTTNMPEQKLPLPMIAERVLGLNTDQLTKITNKACGEYRAASALFAEVASSIADIEAIAARAHGRLVSANDEQIAESLRGDVKQVPARFKLGGADVEVEHETTGNAVVYLFDSKGQRIVAHRFAIIDETPESLCDALGLEMRPEDDVEPLTKFLRGAA